MKTLLFISFAMASLVVAHKPASAQFPSVVRNMLKPSVACAPANEKDARCNCRTFVDKIVDNVTGANKDCKTPPPADKKK